MTMGRFFWKLVCIVFSMVCFAGMFSWFSDGNLLWGLFTGLGGALWALEGAKE